jgi:hypothetical protein
MDSIAAAAAATTRNSSSISNKGNKRCRRRVSSSSCGDDDHDDDHNVVMRNDDDEEEDLLHLPSSKKQRLTTVTTTTAAAAAKTLPRRVSDLTSSYSLLGSLSSSSMSTLSSIVGVGVEVQQQQQPQTEDEEEEEREETIDDFFIIKDDDYDVENKTIENVSSISKQTAFQQPHYQVVVVVQDRQEDSQSITLTTATMAPSESSTMRTNANTNTTTTTTPGQTVRRSSSTTSSFWKVFIEMLSVQCIVWFIATGYYQYTHRLTIHHHHHHHHRTDEQPNQLLSMAPTTTSTNHTISTTSAITAESEDCIYVPGGGFSGFWFSLGRLQSLTLQDFRTQKMVCYSAGCLGYVTTLIQKETSTARGGGTSDEDAGYESLYNMARQIQKDWSDGRIHRYQIVEIFIENILQNLDEIKQRQPSTYTRIVSTMERNLYVTTTVPSSPRFNGGRGGILEATLQQLPPSSSSSYDDSDDSTTTQIRHIKRMLLQTTWIPIAIGPSFTLEGHLDGAFSAIQHPKCKRQVGLEVIPPRSVRRTKSYKSLLVDFWKLWSNTLNVNLPKHDVDHLFHMGYQYGV